VKGVEPNPIPLDAAEKARDSNAGAAEASVAVSAPVAADEGLQAICEKWPVLSHEFKAVILAMVRAACGKIQ
jgi:hypothetical protein